METGKEPDERAGSRGSREPADAKVVPFQPRPVRKPPPAGGGDGPEPNDAA